MASNSEQSSQQQFLSDLTQVNIFICLLIEYINPTYTNDREKS
jgi:hypothetical protein